MKNERLLGGRTLPGGFFLSEGKSKINIKSLTLHFSGAIFFVKRLLNEKEAGK